MRNSFQVLVMACVWCLTTWGLAFPEDFLRPLPPEYLKKVDLRERRQENEWLKVTQSFAFEQTPEEFFHKKSDDRAVIIHKQTAKVLGERENFRWLQVEVQFLRYCVATKKKPREGRLAKYKGNDPKTTWELFWADVLAPDIDSIVPMFRCDDRTEVFATFYDPQGQEIATKGALAFAYLIDEDMDERKMEMLPDEKTYVWFSVPDKAAYWYEWVLK